MAARQARGGGLAYPVVAPVSDELKATIVLFLGLLDEKQRRLFAGLESLKLGRGGDDIVAETLGLDPGTVAKGRRELLGNELDPERVRKAGAGRKPVEKNARDPRADLRTPEKRDRWRSNDRPEMDTKDHRKGVAIPYGIYWAGVPLESYETILNYISTTATKTGLRVQSSLVNNAYETGIKISKKQMNSLAIEFDPALPQWNYTIKPHSSVLAAVC